MFRKSKQVSLEPYGYTLVQRTPHKPPQPERKSQVDEQKKTAPIPLPLQQIDMSIINEQAEIENEIRSGKSNSVGCLVAIAAVVIGVVVLSALASNTSGGSRSSYSASNHDAGMACIMAEKLIKQQLKSPTSAEFDYGDCKSSAIHAGNTWTLRSYVDADNSFGAHIRSYYTAKLSNVPPSDTWRLEYLTLDE